MIVKKKRRLNRITFRTVPFPKDQFTEIVLYHLIQTTSKKTKKKMNSARYPKNLIQGHSEEI